MQQLTTRVVVWCRWSRRRQGGKEEEEYDKGKASVGRLWKQNTNVAKADVKRLEVQQIT